jgi:hypothetical protein
MSDRNIIRLGSQDSKKTSVHYQIFAKGEALKECQQTGVCFLCPFRTSFLTRSTRNSCGDVIRWSGFRLTLVQAPT